MHHNSARKGMQVEAMNDEVSCVECETTLPADTVHDPLDARTPCPNCGSTARRIHRQGRVGMSDAVARPEPAEVRFEAPNPRVVTAPRAGPRAQLATPRAPSPRARPSIT